MFPTTRMQRLRTKPKLRQMVKETTISTHNFVMPIFVDENLKKKREIQSMPEIYSFPILEVNNEVEEVANLKIPAIILFGVPNKKDEIGSSSYAKDGVIQKTIKAIKKQFGDEIIVIADLCLCEYTSHGHCGLIGKGKILNDETLKVYGKIAISYAESGVDIIAPSGMMDGMVSAIRNSLDKEGYEDVAIMSYAVKYSSSFYSPFRDAVYSTPKFFGRETYQMDFSNSNEALREAELDLNEGADILMVKPALAYIDIIYRVKKKFKVPVSAFNVSGEYAMIKAMNDENLIIECLTAIKRAGADIIISYFAKEVAEKLEKD